MLVPRPRTSSSLYCYHETTQRFWWLLVGDLRQLPNQAKSHPQGRFQGSIPGSWHPDAGRSFVLIVSQQVVRMRP